MNISDVSVHRLSLDQSRCMFREVNFPDLSNELLLQIYPHLPLKGLIAAQGVCQKWRQLVPLSDIPSHRRTYYDFYMKLIESPLFFRTRPWVLANLRSFDRQAFLNAVLEQYPHLPEEFTLWILEWPARAVIGCCWPGLPSQDVRRGIPVDPNSEEDIADNVEILEGENFLGRMPPQVSVLNRPDHSYSGVPDWVAVILLWRNCSGDTWLVVDERKELFGKVKDTGISCMIGDEYELELSGWMEWQKYIWSNIQQEFESPLSLGLPLMYPRQKTEGWDGRTPWSRRDEPRKRA